MPLYRRGTFSCLSTLEELTGFYSSTGKLPAVILALSNHQRRTTLCAVPSVPYLSPQSSLPPPKGDSSLASPQKLRKYRRPTKLRQNEEVHTYISAAGIFARSKYEQKLGRRCHFVKHYKLSRVSSAREKPPFKGNEEALTCPMRCARSMACRSLMGFQSCSTNTTVSAPVKLSPSPPT